ncbi:MAG: prephenate dehydrogenase [Actinomycetota bacterium]|nr:prephenate dehydrogenase [Actinomycetota bacterium]
MSEFKRVTLIGVGLIGGSLGLAFRGLPHPPRVIGVARHREMIKKALERGAIDKGTTSLLDGVRGSDVIFVATPVSSIVNIIREIHEHLEPGTIITDVGSTKAGIVRAVEEFLPPHLHFIGGHPMTGSEQAGIDAASGSLFKGAYYLLTPTSRTDTEAFQRLHSLLTAIGATVLAIDPDKHDKVVAAVSHLPHILSAALIDLAQKQMAETENLLLLAAGGFRDMTRIAAGSPDIWTDICLENDVAILQAIEDFQRELGGLSELIRKKDRKKLARELEKSRRARLNLPSILKKDLTQLRELSIPVTDRPGVISDITLAIGRLGINVEDIEIVHATETSGVLRLVLSGARNARKAVAALREKGYEVNIRSVYSEE